MGAISYKSFAEFVAAIRPTCIWRIQWKGQDFLYVGHPNKRDGAICTREQYENFEPGPAHLYPNGIVRFGAVVGVPGEIEWIELVER